MSFFRNGKVIVLFFATVAIVALLVVARLNAYPPPPGNSSIFVPTAINFAAGRGLTDEMGHIRSHTDPDDSRFISYPPLYPVLVAILMPTADTQGAFTAIAIIEGLIVLLTAWLLYKVVRVARTHETINWFDVLLICFGLLAILAPLLLYNSTRPDILFQLVSLLWLMLVVYFPRSKYLWVFFGLILGISGAVHPLHAFYFALLTGIFFSFKLHVKPALLETLKTYLLGATVLLSILAIMPYGIIDTLSGVLTQTGRYGGGLPLADSVTHSRTSWGVYAADLFRYLVTSPSSFLWGPFALFLVVLMSRFYKKIAPSIASRFLFFLFLLPLLTMMAGIIVGHTDSIYYLTMFGSLFLVLSVYIVSRDDRVVPRLLLAALLFAMSISTIRVFALMPSYFSSGTTIAEARKLYEELDLPDCKDCIGISPASLWTLSENYSSLVTSLQTELSGERLGEKVRVILLGQQGSSLTQPPETFSGCPLEKDYFTKASPPRLLGIKMAHIVPGYGFAVYRCSNDQ